MGLEEKYSPPNKIKPISPLGLGLTFFAFLIFYLSSGKSLLQAEIYFSLTKIVLELQAKLAPPPQN